MFKSQTFMIILCIINTSISYSLPKVMKKLLQGKQCHQVVTASILCRCKDKTIYTQMYPTWRFLSILLIFPNEQCRRHEIHIGGLPIVLRLFSTQL